MSRPIEQRAIQRRDLLKLLAGTAGVLALHSAAACRPSPSAGTPATGGSQAAAGAPRRGGTLRYGLSSDTPNLDPHIYTGRAIDLVKRQAYSSLLKMAKGPNGVVVAPDLAESWEQSDDRTYLFKLRQGVRFHNGDPVTAGDITFSLGRILEPKTGAKLLVQLSVLEAMDVIDPATVRLTLKRPSAALLEQLADDNAGIVSRTFVESGVDLKTTMMGTGPYTFVDRQPGVEIKFQRNDQYYDRDLPHLGGITFLPHPDDTARVNALRSGAVDMIDYVPWRNLPALSKDQSYAIYSDSDTTGMWLQFNLTKPPFDNPIVRQAVAWAIDRQAILDNAFFGRGEVMTGGVIPKANPLYTSFEGAYGYDSAKARQLLAEAGYPDGFQASLLSTFQYGMHKDTSEIIAGNLQQVGIQVNLDLVDWPTNTARRGKGQFDLYMLGSTTGGDPDLFMTENFQTKATYNYGGFSDQTVDSLLDQGRSTYDAAQRKATYAELERHLLEVLPSAFVVRREQAEASTASVKGYTHLLGSTSSGTSLAESWLAK